MVSEGTRLLAQAVVQYAQKIPKEMSHIPVYHTLVGSCFNTLHHLPSPPKSSMSDDSYEFFFRAESPFSQWHFCTFELDGRRFNCAEQGTLRFGLVGGTATRVHGQLRTESFATALL